MQHKMSIYIYIYFFLINASTARPSRRLLAFFFDRPCSDMWATWSHGSGAPHSWATGLMWSSVPRQLLCMVMVSPS